MRRIQFRSAPAQNGQAFGRQHHGANIGAAPTSTVKGCDLGNDFLVAEGVANLRLVGERDAPRAPVVLPGDGKVLAS